MRVQCPGCRLVLKVPDNSAGKHARCPSCKTKFFVPRRADAIEETISSWIEEDVEQMQAENREALERKNRPAVESAPVETPAPPAAKPEPAPAAAAAQPSPQPVASAAASRRDDADAVQISPQTPETQEAPQTDSSDTMTARLPTASAAAAQPDTPDEALDLPRERAETPRQEEPAPPPPAAGGDEAHFSHGGRPASPGPAAAAELSLSETALTARASEVASTLAASWESDDATFPADILPTGPHPHLVVESCSAEGVRLAFDSAWMEHPGFQASLPQRCIYGGTADRSELLLRPLAFIDRSRAAVRAARDIEVRYEQHLSSNQTIEQMLKAIGKMEYMPPPFNSPVAYFVSPAHARNSLTCTTKTRAAGGYTCVVLVPDGQYALDWLERVNGVTGRDYRLLKKVVGLMWNEAWSKIPEEARRRIAVWCTFEPMESFKIFLPDADFAKPDYGLGGMVLTDRRLIFSKFHRRGQCGLRDNAILQVQTEDDFALLSLNNDAGKTKVAKLHLADLPALIKALSGSPGLKLQVG